MFKPELDGDTLLVKSGAWENGKRLKIRKLEKKTVGACGAQNGRSQLNEVFRNYSLTLSNKKTSKHNRRFCLEFLESLLVVIIFVFLLVFTS